MSANQRGNVSTLWPTFYPFNPSQIYCFMPSIKSAQFSTIICFLAVFLTFSASQVANGQEVEDQPITGYIVTTEADTLYGSFTPGNDFERSWRVSFKEDGADEFEIYRPIHLHAYHIDGVTNYYSVTGYIEEEGEMTLFIREESRGPVRLYSTMAGPENRVFFIRDRAGNLGVLNRSVYIDQLSNAFGACRTVLGREDRAHRTYRYRLRDMIRLFEEYHECMNVDPFINPQVRREVAEPEQRRVQLGVWAGGNISNFRITERLNLYWDVPMDFVPGFTVGAFADIALQHNQLYFRPELVFTTRGGETVTPFPGAGIPDPIPASDDYVEGSFSFINLGLPLRYEFPVLGQQFYGTGGGMLGFLIGRSATAQRDVINEDGEIEPISGDIIDFFGDISIGVHLGVGLRLPVGNYNLFLETRYSRIFNNISDNVDNFRTTALEVMVGLGF